MKYSIFPFILLVLCAFALAGGVEPVTSVQLWPDKVNRDQSAPMERLKADRGDNVIRVTHIENPSMLVYPAINSGEKTPAVLICPGGGYAHLALDKEGTEIAEWLNRIGVAAFVLKYRVPGDRTASFQDAQRALRLIRHRAAEWNIDPARVGMMGFSAGGHLTARLSTDFAHHAYAPVNAADQMSCRPDFSILVYPAYLADKNSRLAAELPVSKEVPPTLIVHSQDDKQFIGGSRVYGKALRDTGVSVRFECYSAGGHGFGLRLPSDHPTSQWTGLCEQWLQEIAVLPGTFTLKKNDRIIFLETP